MIITLKDIEIYIEQYTVQNIQNTLFSCLDNCAGREWHPVPRREDVARQRLCPVGSWCRGWGAGASQGSGSAQTSTTHGTNALCPPPSSILPGTKPGSTALWGIPVGQWVTSHQAKLILCVSPSVDNMSSSTSQNMLLLLRMGCLCSPDHSHSNRKDAIYITATCRTQVVLVYREAMKIKTCIKHELLQSDSQMGESNGCFAKQQLRARLPLTLGIIVMETTSKVAQNTSRYEKGS